MHAIVQEQSQHHKDFRKEFRDKNVILSRFGQQISPLEYLEKIFGTNDFIVCGPWGVTIIPHADREDIFFLSPVDQIFIPYCSFFQNYYSLKTAKQLLCLVVDIEHLTPLQVETMFRHMFALKGFIKPTYVVNSGRGIHFVYQLQNPLELYNRVKPAVKKMAQKLCSKIKKTFERWDLVIDYPASCDFAHAFRAPGTMTKIGEVATVFHVGEAVTQEQMEEFLQIELPKIESKIKPKKEEFRKKENPMSVEVLPRGHQAFYYYCFRTLRLDAHKSENRYLALFGLAVVGWKCRIPREDVRMDLLLLQEMWNRNAEKNGLPLIKDNEIEKAMKGYSPKYTLVRAEVLGEWLGITFRKNKRNYRKRKEHLEWMFGNRIKESRAKVVSVLLELKGAPTTIKEIIEATGMARNTVRRRLRELGLTNEHLHQGTYMKVLFAQFGGEGQNNDIIPPYDSKYHGPCAQGKTEEKTELPLQSVTHDVHFQIPKPECNTDHAHFEVMRESENHDRASP